MATEDMATPLRTRGLKAGDSQESSLLVLVREKFRPPLPSCQLGRGGDEPGPGTERGGEEALAGWKGGGTLESHRAATSTPAERDRESRCHLEI